MPPARTLTPGSTAVADDTARPAAPLTPAVPVPAVTLNDTGRLLGAKGTWQRRALLRVAAIAVLLGLWQLAASSGRWSPVFVPSPGAVFQALITTSTTHDGIRGFSGHFLIEHLGISLQRIALGSIIGVIGGLLLGILMGAVGWVRIVLEPLITFIRALPPLAYFSLLVIWFGIDETPKIWLLTIAALPPVAVATTVAVLAAPTNLIEAARALGASRLQALKEVVLPSALPEILTGVRLAVGIAYSSVVAAETINGLPGIGGMVRDAQRYNQTDVVILGLFAIGLSGLAIDAVLRYAERRLTPWRGLV